MASLEGRGPLGHKPESSDAIQSHYRHIWYMVHCTVYDRQPVNSGAQVLVLVLQFLSHRLHRVLIIVGYYKIGLKLQQ